MKKTIQIIVMAALCLFFTKPVRCQVIPLEVGSMVPDLTLTDFINDKSSTVKLSDFRGKMLILDFWASWCGACVFTFPKTDSLQKAFEGKIQFLPVAYQSEREVRPFIQQMEKSRGLKISTLVNDKILSRLFPHNVFPHYVWIGEDGRVKAITGNEAVNAETIQTLLSGYTYGIPFKKDIKIPYDRKKPLMVDNNGGNGNNLLFRSLLLPYAQGLLPGFTVQTDSVFGKRLTARNLGLNMIYWVAFTDKGTFNNSNTILEVADPSRLKSSEQGAAYEYWSSQGNAFSYELIVPPHDAKNMYKYMQEDLRRYFPQYTASVENKPVTAYVLVRTDSLDRIASKGAPREVKTEHLEARFRNSTIAGLMNTFRNFYLQNTTIPITDDTGYPGRIDIDLSGDLFTIDGINKALSNYGLTFIKAERKVKLLVIRDSKPIITKTN